jgi:hypothetical protein
MDRPDWIDVTMKKQQLPNAKTREPGSLGMRQNKYVRRQNLDEAARHVVEGLDCRMSVLPKQHTKHANRQQNHAGLEFAGKLDQ